MIITANVLKLKAQKIEAVLLGAQESDWIWIKMLTTKKKLFKIGFAFYTAVKSPSSQTH